MWNDSISCFWSPGFVFLCAKCLITTDYEIIDDIVTNVLNYISEYNHIFFLFCLRMAKLTIYWDLQEINYCL
jgi:hypothetical protein